MGNRVSKRSIDETSETRNFSHELGISQWEPAPAKNADYYLGNRFFKISRSHYPYYERGYLWGYNCDYKWKLYQSEAECSDCGQKSNVWCERTGSCPLCLGIKPSNLDTVQAQA